MGPLAINREPSGQCLNPIPYRCLDLTIARFAVLRKAVENLGDQGADFLEFGGAEATGGPGGGAEADA